MLQERQYILTMCATFLCYIRSHNYNNSKFPRSNSGLSLLIIILAVRTRKNAIIIIISAENY